MDNYKVQIGDEQRAIDINYVSGLLVGAFGIPALPFPDVKQDGGADGLEVAYNVTVDEYEEYDKAPVRYGQKTWGAFWFKMDADTKVYNDDGKLEEVELAKILMPLASLISFSRPKKITETNEVIEIYQMSKWSISIQGVIVNDPSNPVGQQTVLEQMEAIEDYHEIAGAIGVEGQIFSDRKISRIVTKDLRFDPVQGKPGMMRYSIEAVSDEDFLAIYR